MATAEATRLITPEEFLDMPDGKGFELVGGELVEKNMGWESSWSGGRIVYFLTDFILQNPIGEVCGVEAGFRCFPEDPLKVRKPDISFLSNERLPPSEELKGWCRVAPNLAVEVVSPRDLDLELDEKVAEYLAAGVELVWVVRPPLRTVRVHRADGSITNLRAADMLDGENVLPGFQVQVAQHFRSAP